MTTLSPPPDLPTPVVVRRAAGGDRTPLERLWLIFRHEMSTHTHGLPNRDGTYRRERLLLGLSDPSWTAWILAAGDHPIGFALVRALDQPVHVLNSFFVVAPARRRGLGLQFARAVVAANPGRWTVAFQGANTAATRFWPRLAASFTSDWDLEYRPVPDRPDLPPDTWVTFEADRPS
jgi:predicted acetyltransferase